MQLGSRDGCIRWGSISSEGKGEVWGGRFNLMSICYYGIGHCVAGRETYSVRVRKFDKISVRPTISLEMSVRWLSGVSFEMEVGVYEKFERDEGGPVREHRDRRR